MLTAYGKELRKIRIDREEILKDMSDKLKMTPSYLSAIECGKRSIPKTMTSEISKIYSLKEKESLALKQAEEKTNKFVTLNLDGVTNEKQDLAILFARSFEKMDDNTATQVKEWLKEKGEF